MIWLGIGALLLAAFLYLNNAVFVTSQFLIASPDVKEETRVLLLSDVHTKRLGRCFFKRVAKLHPHVIVVAGDLFDRRRMNLARAKCLLENLKELGEVFYSPGNHEYHLMEREAFFRSLQESGICVLRAQCVKTQGLAICGLDYLGYRPFLDAELKRLERQTCFRLFFTHFPQYFEGIYAKYEVDLVLAGHAHGGQFRVPFWKKGLYAPGQGIFPKYTEGLHEREGVQMIVSRGIGNSRFPFRLFNCPEILCVAITPQREE